LTVGSDVNAIGHPKGEAWTFTRGVISQIRQAYKWKTADGLEHVATVIQTQTPINPGNSGGPLISTEGKLIGVNTFKSDGEGLNYAVSVNEVRRLLTARTDRIATSKQVAPLNTQTCTPKSYGVSRLDDNSGSVEMIDFDCSGKPFAVKVVPDDKAAPIVLAIDSKHEGRASVFFYDVNRDGIIDFSDWESVVTGENGTIRCTHAADGEMIKATCERV
jgi:hypothetical protein